MKRKSLKDRMIELVDQANKDLTYARMRFEAASEEFVEGATHALIAAEKQYVALLKECQEMGITRI